MQLSRQAGNENELELKRDQKKKNLFTYATVSLKGKPKVVVGI